MALAPLGPHEDRQLSILQPYRHKVQFVTYRQLQELVDVASSRWKMPKSDVSLTSAPNSEGRAHLPPTRTAGPRREVAPPTFVETGRIHRDAFEDVVGFLPLPASSDPSAHGLLSVPQSEIQLTQRSDAKGPGNAPVILGHLDPVEGTDLRGWAYDRISPDVPVTLDVVIDDVLFSSPTCNVERPDVAAVGHPTAVVGFRLPVPKQYMDGQEHVVEIRPKRDDLRPLRTAQLQGASRRTFNLAPQVDIGRVDGLHAGAVRGWVFRHDRVSDIKTGGLTVLVTMQGHPVAQIAAREFRPDVAAAHGCDPNCGFAFFPPTNLVAGRTVEFEFRLIPGAYVLANSPIRANFPTPETIAAVRHLSDAADKASAELWLLRNRLRELTMDNAHTVENYDAWARQYRQALAAAPRQLELLPAAAALPLVSIICPVHKPRLGDFVAA